MINITLMGGLGNQMFQYALGRSLQERGRQVVFNKRDLLDSSDAPHALNRPQYGLDGFCTKLEFAPPSGPEITDNDMPFRPDIYNASGDCTLTGHWQSEKYFWGIRDKLIKEFQPIPGSHDNKGLPYHLIARMMEPNSVMVHVRRGDYVGLQSYHGLMTKEYYQEAIKRIHKENPYTDPRFFIFSDDPNWCSENLDGEVVDTGDRWLDIYLMSLCQHAIIGNSSFGWWGAWLHSGAARTVIAPTNWFTVQHLDSRDIVPERWIRMGKTILDRAVVTVGTGVREDVGKQGEQEIIGKPFATNIDRFVSQMRTNSPGTKVITFRNVLPPQSPTHKERPYAFKVWAIQETRRLGYEKIIWADTSVIAIRNMQSLWDLIDGQGYWLSRNGPNTCGEWTSDEALDILQLTRNEAFKIPQIIGTAFGLNLQNELAEKFFDAYKAYSETEAFNGPWTNENCEASVNPAVLGHRHDQTVASVIAHRLGMKLNVEPFAFMANEPEFPEFYTHCPLFIERNGKDIRDIRSLYPPYVEGSAPKIEPVQIVITKPDDATLKARQESARRFREQRKGRR